MNTCANNQPPRSERHAQPRESISILTIGNSFSDNATEYLPALASAGGKRLVLGKANVGGASFEAHVRWLGLAEAGDAVGRAYKDFIDPRTGGPCAATLQEALTAARWDVVTLQQFSELSHKLESFQPSVEQLIETIRRHAPSAEIVFHSTWSYRDDHPWFQLDPSFTQECMQAQIRETYLAISRQTGFRVIPVGDAFARARKNSRWTYAPDPAFNFDDPPQGMLPRQEASLHAGWYWKMDAEGGPKLELDAKHLGPAGKYLGACVWYQSLFNADEAPAGFVPPALRPDDAADLRRRARPPLASFSVR
ncbi:DUF4886 domain-containing protein [Rariglobus hedericola]|uniref:DUF4886 domain-containing protein n=1 Tax=Rariglobus hedericola TaxID=2597822 RepID=A0A556QPG6_9BACT|nr:DUF4886 domain-containing protein [Rariglobus hedericola]TSJ78526.1 DUF4886 domain-containing protein [Rariglobus hedericola]